MLSSGCEYERPDPTPTNKLPDQSGSLTETPQQALYREEGHGMSTAKKRRPPECRMSKQSWNAECSPSWSHWRTDQVAKVRMTIKGLDNAFI